VIFAIEEADPKAFLEENRALLDSGKNYGWPGDWYKSSQPAEWLKREGYSVYLIQSSMGLDGWVIAKKATVS